MDVVEPEERVDQAAEELAETERKTKKSGRWLAALRGPATRGRRGDTMRRRTDSSRRSDVGAPSKTSRAMPVEAGGDTATGGSSTKINARKEVRDEPRPGPADETEEDFLTVEEVRALPRDVLDEVVKVVHGRYIAAVRRLHAETAPKYGSACDQELEIISSHTARDPRYLAKIFAAAAVEAGGSGVSTDVRTASKL